MRLGFLKNPENLMLQLTLILYITPSVLVAYDSYIRWLYMTL